MKKNLLFFKSAFVFLRQKIPKLKQKPKPFFFRTEKLQSGLFKNWSNVSLEPKFYRFDEAGSIAEVDKHWIKFQLRESTRDSPKGSSEMLHEFVITTGKAKKWQTHQKYGILRGPDF